MTLTGYFFVKMRFRPAFFESERLNVKNNTTSAICFSAVAELLVHCRTNWLRSCMVGLFMLQASVKSSVVRTWLPASFCSSHDIDIVLLSKTSRTDSFNDFPPVLTQTSKLPLRSELWIPANLSEPSNLLPRLFLTVSRACKSYNRTNGQLKWYR